MAILVCGFVGFATSAVLTLIWVGLDLMFGIGYGQDAALGLTMVMTGLGAATGAIFTVIWS